LAFSQLRLSKALIEIGASLLSTCVPLIESGSTSHFQPASPGEGGASATTETRGRLGSISRKTDQPRDPGSPCCARRPGTQASGGLAFSRLRLSKALIEIGASLLSTCVPLIESGSTSHFQPASPGESGASVTTQTRGRLGSIFANLIDHAIPARRAAHVVRERRLRVGWLCRDCVCLKRSSRAAVLPTFNLRPRAKAARQRRRRPGVA